MTSTDSYRHLIVPDWRGRMLVRGSSNAATRLTRTALTTGWDGLALDREETDHRDVHLEADEQASFGHDHDQFQFCHVRELGGESSPLDLRRLLAAEGDRLRQDGIEVNVGFEVECTVFSREEHSRWLTQPESLARQRRYFTSPPAAGSHGQVLARAVDLLRDRDVELWAHNLEFESYQVEVATGPATPTRAADLATFAAAALREAALDLGSVAIFAPQPFSNGYGNGLHVHLSARDSDGRDVLSAKMDAIWTALSEATLAFCPTSNSYKRLSGPEWSKVMDRSAIESRNAWLRWIESPDSTQRLEVRLADSCASPYVVLAVLLRALQESESFVTAPSARGPATSLAEALTRYETAGWALGALSDEVRQLIRDGAERDLRGSLQWVTDRERQQHGLD